MIESYFAYSLSAAHRAVHQSLASRAKAQGLQVEAWRVLEALDSGERPTMGQLAQKVLMNPSALSKLVDRMVSDGLVHRQIGREDQRQVNLLITALGTKRMHQMRESVREHDQAIRDLLGADEAEHIQELLQRLSTIKG